MAREIKPKKVLVFWNFADMLFWGDILFEQKSATKHISGAREEDLTDPHPVLRLNRPAQHRRFYLAMYFLLVSCPYLFVSCPYLFVSCTYLIVSCPYLFVVDIFMELEHMIMIKSDQKINYRCAILLGLRDTENDHGVIKVSKLVDLSIWQQISKQWQWRWW